MIYDTLENIKKYFNISENLEKGLRFLSETDFTAMPAAVDRISIDGDNVFAFVQQYMTVPANEKAENHQKYIDIMYLIDGEELVGVAPLCDMGEEYLPRPDGDIRLYHGTTEKLTIGRGKLLVLFPSDAHAPGIAKDKPAQVRKCVVKVKYQD